MLASILALALATPLPELSIHTLIPFAEASPKVWTVEEMKSLATKKAKEHGLKVQKFLDVVNCESGWDTNAEGDFVKDEPTSFGLAQLHNIKEDWGVTESEAKNPEIALEIMARAWERNEAWRWSCWRPS